MVYTYKEINSCFGTSATVTSTPAYPLIQELHFGRKNPNSKTKATKRVNSVKYHFRISLTNSLIFMFEYFHFTSRTRFNLAIIT